ncbi:hypothetical protein DL766_006552 [Monosporascus sp. MC13-8B]|nr:hypothetical protein DL766_006552 [Monosporascus sp. MC13-8B]
MGDYIVNKAGTAATPSNQGGNADEQQSPNPNPNPDLTGHKLLILTPFDLSTGWADAARARYPGLAIEHNRHNPWAGGPGGGGPPEDVDWRDVTVLVTGPVLPSPRDAPRLQLVQLQTAGANYVLKHPLFRDTKVAFCTANGVHGPQIAEWVIMTYLAFQHRLPYYLDKQKEGYWDCDSHDMDTIDTVHQRIGILGYGSIGRQVARVATAMGSEVYAYTAHPRQTPGSRRDNAYYVPGLGDPEGVLPSRWFSGTSEADLNEFLASGLDLLVVATPLTPQTRGMLGRAQFRVLAEAEKKDKERKGKKTYVANVGRGPIVDTEALMEALDEGWIRGAALDVTDPEPLPREHPLWHKPNLIVTPHVSGNSTHYIDRLMAIVDINLERLSRGEKFINQVNKKQGY